MQEIELRPRQVAQGSGLWRWRLWLDTGYPFQKRKKHNETPKHVERHVTISPPLHEMQLRLVTI
jgi:hypothetical protein